MRDSTADRCPPIVMSSPCTVATMSSPLMRPLHTQRRCQFLFPILCGVTCAVQAVSQQSTHMFVTRLVVLGQQFDKHFSSCWSVQVRPPHIDQCQYLSLTFARCDLRQYDFQRLQWRCRRIQLWSGVCLVLLRNPSRVHIRLSWLSFVGLRPPCLDGRMHFILELASDVNSCTKYRPCAGCASYSSHRNSIWSLSFFLHPLFRSLSETQ